MDIRSAKKGTEPLKTHTPEVSSSAITPEENKAPGEMMPNDEDFDGNIGLLAEPVEGGTATVLNEFYITEQLGGVVEYLNGIGRIGNTVDISGLADGTYRVYLASKALNETEWQTVHSNENIVNNYIVTKQGMTATVTDGEGGWTTGIENVAAGIASGDGTVRVYTVDGVLVYTSPADMFSLEDVPTHGLLIIKNGAHTVKVMK